MTKRIFLQRSVVIVRASVRRVSTVLGPIKALSKESAIIRKLFEQTEFPRLEITSGQCYQTIFHAFITLLVFISTSIVSASTRRN